MLFPKWGTIAFRRHLYSISVILMMMHRQLITGEISLWPFTLRLILWVLSTWHSLIHNYWQTDSTLMWARIQSYLPVSADQLSADTNVTKSSFSLCVHCAGRYFRRLPQNPADAVRRGGLDPTHPCSSSCHRLRASLPVTIVPKLLSVLNWASPL